MVLFPSRKCCKDGTTSTGSGRTVKLFAASDPGVSCMEKTIEPVPYPNPAITRTV